MGTWILLVLTTLLALLLAPVKVKADTIRGVNIGGWLLLESWITPSVFNGQIDEWSLTASLGKGDSLNLLDDHWNSFYTRDDFVTIKSQGLNHVRIPIGYWAVDVADYEPYVTGQYPYLVRAVEWCKEIGLGVMIDLHGLPGSQNGQDNSGLTGPVLFAMNTTNAQRSLAVLKNLSTEFSQSVYGGTVTDIELQNEPRLDGSNFTMTILKSFYTTAATIIRNTSSSGIRITVHDAFYGPNYWSNYDPLNSIASTSPSWLQLDTHQYYAFPPFQNLPHDIILKKVCNISAILKSKTNGIPSTVVGEWSLETGTSPNASERTGRLDTSRLIWFRLLFESQLAAYSPNAAGQPSRGWYFWTWKTEYNIDTWSYNYGVQRGYIPQNISNASQLAYPILPNGCVDSTFNYIPSSAIEQGRKTSRLLCLVVLAIGLYWIP